MCFDEPSDNTQQDELTPIEKIKELYRASDRLVEAQADGAAQNGPAIEEARERLKALMRHQSQEVGARATLGAHDWVLNVLEDLACYAAYNRLEPLENDLLQTLTRLEGFLNK